MTRDDVIRMAREVGLLRVGDGWTEPARWGLAEIERFAELVVVAEYERGLLDAMNATRAFGKTGEVIAVIIAGLKEKKV